MLTVEKLKAMKPGEIFAKGEAIDDGKVFNIWGEGHELQRVAVRGKGYHDRAIYYHLYKVEGQPAPISLMDLYYYGKWCLEKIANVGDKLTGERTIRTIVPCDDEAFNLYRY